MGVGGDWAENVVWCVNDIKLLQSVRSVDINCSTNNIDTINSDETNLYTVAIARCISHCYPNIQVIVGGLLPKNIHWSAQRVKIEKTSAYLKDHCDRSTKMTFMTQDQSCSLPANFLNIQLYYKDYLHLMEKGNIKPLWISY